MKSYSRCAALAVTAALTGACASTDATPRPESEALARSRLMLARLDRLEADLHSEATATDTYAVLQERHGEASQIACKVTDDHVNEMHRLLMAQLEKRKEKVALRAQRNKKRAALGRAHASSTRPARSRPGHAKGKAGRASASAGSPASAPGRASAASSSHREDAPPASVPAPATTPARAAPATTGHAPSAAGRAPGNSTGALSMR
jgi:hypothetical protein